MRIVHFELPADDRRGVRRSISELTDTEGTVFAVMQFDPAAR